MLSYLGKLKSRGPFVEFAVRLLSSESSSSSSAELLPQLATASLSSTSKANESQPGTSGRVSTSAPWPWIDPSRPQILPAYIKLAKAGPSSILDALQQIKANAEARLEGSTPRDKLTGRPRVSTRFDETVELIVNLGVDPRKGDQIVRGAVVLPHGTGKKVRICVFAKGSDADAAREAGADIVGDDALIQQIIDTAGKAIDFNRVVATPEFMKPLARAGKIMGPKGLMPNPKLGTLTSNVAGAVKEMRQGRLEYRVDKEGILHAGVGKVSMSTDQLLANIGALVQSLLDNRPKVLPGTGLTGYFRSVFAKSSQTSALPVASESCLDAVTMFQAGKDVLTASKNVEASV